ncbi:MAG: peptidase [Acidobacteria bacterium]|nr:peptidase [Acidobacteriota bacterium]
MLRSAPLSLRLITACVVLSLIATAGFAGIVDPKVTAKLSTTAAGSLVPVVVTWQSAPAAADVAALRALGVSYGVTLQQLPMTGVWATPAQVESIAALPNVRSVYLNDSLRYFNYEGSALIGASEQRTLPSFGYSGRGIGVAIVDSGVDATHADLPYPSHVKQNVKVLTGGASLGSPFTGIVPVTYLENLPDSDSTSGHGTHAAGSIAGLGTQSGGKFAGVAPGCNLVGISTGEAIAVLWALEGFDYVLTHQYLYNIRVVSNSWGTTGPYDAEDPINVASKAMHDRGITVVFAAGNEGPGNNTLNPYSVAPWVIGVAAGDKQGRLADFSSRGIQDDAIYHPTIAAPGVDITSVKAALTPLGEAGTCSNLTPAETPYYACMSGTSMATPHVAGATALVLEANPTLTPDQIKSIMRATATPMAGYKEHQTGAGYLNILASLDVAKNPAKAYGAVLNQTYHARFTGSSASERWSQAFDPTGAPPTHNYTVGANGLESDVFISWGSEANTFNLAVTDPSGTTTSTGSNLTAAVYGLQASLAIANPAAGAWHTTIYGLKGMSTGTTGIGVPDTVDGTLINYYGTFSGMNDVGASPYAAFIRRAVMLRLMDSRTTNTFAPALNVTRGEAAKIIASDCYVRQSQLNALPYTDVSASLAPYVQAVTAAGGPLRDTFMTAGGVMGGTSATSFAPNGNVNRADLAVWLVRALGKDADARANATASTTYTDDAQIPASARGYVVVASNLGLMSGFANPSPVEGAPVTYSWQPLTNVTRGAMAVTIDKWYDLFMTP